MLQNSQKKNLTLVRKLTVEWFYKQAILTSHPWSVKMQSWDLELLDGYFLFMFRSVDWKDDKDG